MFVSDGQPCVGGGVISPTGKGKFSLPLFDYRLQCLFYLNYDVCLLCVLIMASIILIRSYE